MDFVDCDNKKDYQVEERFRQDKENINVRKFLLVVKTRFHV